MARIDNLTNFLTDVATSIKAKTGDNTPIPASQFDTKIAGITAGKLSNEEYTKANNDLDEILYQSQNVLPNTYQEVEYIESTGTQYIDTRVAPTINTKARVKFAPTMYTGHGYFGARHDPVRFCCTTFEGATYFAVGMSVNTWPANRTILSLDTIYDCVFGNGYANINGTNYTETVYSSFGEAGSFKLASYREENSCAKYYLCQMWENDILIFYGIPCYRKSDDKPGMYDTVNNVFYTNEGTGDFIVGEDVDVLNRKIESVLTEKNTKIIPINIKKDVNILGVTGTYEGSSGYPPDWSQIGYEDTPQDILDDFNYSKDIKDNWDSSVTDISYRFNADTTLRYIPIIDTGNATNMRNAFNGCAKITFFPQLNTGNATNMRNMLSNCNSLINVSTFDTSSATNIRGMFQNCTELVSVPLLNTSKVTDISFIFSNCLKLSNESLNNILQMCINATSYTGTKTLQQLGLTSAQATTCQSLSNYQDFINAGWTTGY